MTHDCLVYNISIEGHMITLKLGYAAGVHVMAAKAFELIMDSGNYVVKTFERQRLMREAKIRIFLIFFFSVVLVLVQFQL